MLTLDITRRFKEIEDRLKVVEDKLSPQLPTMWSEYWPEINVNFTVPETPTAQIIPFHAKTVRDN